MPSYHPNSIETATRLNQLNTSLLIALIAGTVFLGGSANAAVWQLLIVCFLASALIPIAVAGGALRRFTELPKAARGVALAVAILPLLQLIPLPPSLWQALSGRELATEIFLLLGTESQWRGLSLVPRDTLFAFLIVAIAAAAFLATLNLDRQARKHVVLGLLAAAVASVLVGVIQFGTSGGSLDLYGSAHRGSLLGFFANRNHQGLFIAISAAFAISAIKRRFRDPRLALALAILVSISALIAAVGTVSRAGIALTILGVGAAFYSGFVHGRVKWPVVAGGVAASVFVIYFLTFNNTVQTALARFSQVEENGRFEIWEKTSPLIEQFFPWGAGIGSFTSTYPPIEQLEDINPFYFNRVHNEYFELLIEAGIPGLAILLLFMSVFGQRVWRVFRGEDDLGPFAIPAGVSVVLVGLHSIVDYPLRTLSHAVVFALACGLFFSLPRSKSKTGEGGAESCLTGSRSAHFRAISLAAQTVAVTAVAFFLVLQREGADQPQGLATNLASPEGQVMSAAQLASAKRALSRQPLDQALLNAVFVSEVRNGIAGAQRRAYASTLAQMGWRHTQTQQNLLFEAAQRNDLPAALDHMDALLRRDQLTEQIMVLLMQLEIDPVGTQLMAEKLTGNPVWRSQYFRFAEPLADPDILDARLQLFAFMAEQNMLVDQTEMRATTLALFSAGRKQELADLVRSLMPADKRSQLLFDPEFERWLGTPVNERWQTHPTDWRLTNRSGVTSQIIAEEWSSRLVLRWNGRGAPIMARTMTFLKQGEKPRLEVSLSAGSELRGLDSLRFSLVCPGIREVVFVHRPGWSSGHPGMDRRISVYEAEDASACDYPELFIGGRPQIGDRGANLSIDSIELALP